MVNDILNEIVGNPDANDLLAAMIPKAIFPLLPLVARLDFALVPFEGRLAALKTLYLMEWEMS